MLRVLLPTLLGNHDGPTDQPTDGQEGPWGSYTSKKWSEEPVLSEQNETCYIHMYMQLSTTALIKQRVPIIMIKGLPNS